MGLTLKQVKKIFVLLLAIAIYSNVFAQERRYERVDVNITNLHYDSGDNTVKFTLELKAGDGYVPGSSQNGQWSAMNIYIDIYPEAGVLLNTQEWDPVSEKIISKVTNDAMALKNFDIEHASTVATNNPGGLVAGTVPLGINLSREWLGANDITGQWGVAANYCIPLEPGSVAPTSATYMVIRERNDIVEDGWNTVFASLWSNQRDAQPLSGPIKSRRPLYPIRDTSSCPEQAIWIGSVSSDWFDADNWADPSVDDYPLLPLYNIPGPCTKVFIPGSNFRGASLNEVNPIRNFPNLTAAAVCNEIVFFHGGQIGRIDLLTYEKARVQLSWDEPTVVVNDAQYHNANPANYYKFAKGYSAAGLTPGAWNMLAIPLQGIVSGDLAYGGSPFTFVRRFDAVGYIPFLGDYGTGETDDNFNGDNAEDIFGVGFSEGKWSDLYRETDIGFWPGSAFAFYAYSQADLNALNAEYASSNLFYTRNDKYNKAGAPYGLGVTLGIMQFPTYDDEITLRSHRVQEYNPTTKVSTFYEVSSHENSMGSLMTAATTRNRSGSGEFKLISSLESFKDAYEFDIINVTNGNINYQVAGSDYALVGNPYMSALDFDAFCVANSGTPFSGIQENYQIWNGSTFDSYVRGSVSTAGMTKYIPPMQGFFIKSKGGEVVAKFNKATMTTVIPFSERNNVKLRNASADNEQNIIHISTQHNDKSSRTVIAQRMDATPDYVEDEDVTKLFSSHIEFPDVPEVYTLADGTALSINFINGVSAIIPIGIRIPESGETTLTLTGMINYAAEKIELMDTEKDEVIDITGRENFNITFANEKSGYQSERFYLRITQSTTGSGATNVQSGIQIYRSGKAIQVVSSPNDLIKQIRIYDVQGRMLYNNTDVNTNIYQVADRFETERILVVQAVTEKNTNSVKIKN